MKRKLDKELWPKKIEYPTKTTINLMNAAALRGNTRFNVMLFVVFLIVLIIFAKFAVVDPLSLGMQSNAEVQAAKEQLAALEAENHSYTDLSAQYSRYVVTGLTEEEINRADRTELIDLLRTTVLGTTHLSSVKVVGNTVTILCVGITLQDASSLVQSLEQDSRIAHVTVSTAAGGAGSESSATIQLELKSPTAKKEGGTDA